MEEEIEEEMEEERRKVDLQSSESYFVPAPAAPAVLKSSRKKRLHTVRQGPQKADGVLCNKHLGLSSAGNSSRKPLTLFPITFWC